MLPPGLSDKDTKSLHAARNDSILQNSLLAGMIDLLQLFVVMFHLCYKGPKGIALAKSVCYYVQEKITGCPRPT